MPQSRRPLVIAHRGASGYLPEHTLPAYALAAFQGADYLEPDLVATRDHRLIARHDNALHLTTDVAERAEFADRHTTKEVDGTPVTGWFSEDFTLAEVRSLRAIERIPEVRPANARFDGQFLVPTLEDLLGLIRALEPVLGRTIGVYPETKHPSYFRALGLPLEEPMVAALHAAGYASRDAPVFLQSFEVGNLERLQGMTDLRRVQLLWKEGAPWDLAAEGSDVDYAALASADGLRDVARYADAVGPEKDHFLHAPGAGGRREVSPLIRHAHEAGLEVHAFTFRAEDAFLPNDLRGLPRGAGVGSELGLLFEAGLDGAFCDQPDLAVRAARAIPAT